jgi:hypothetical protein
MDFKLLVKFVLVSAALQAVFSTPLGDLQKRLNNGLAITPPMGQVLPRV